jgi:RNA polymerase-binding transcription factor DksA
MDRRSIRRRLEEEKERLIQMLETSEESVHANPSPADPGPTELSAVDQHPADAGSELFERQKEFSIRGNAESRFLDIEDALR